MTGNWQLIAAHARGNIFGIILYQTEIKLYLEFFEWFGTKRKSIWCQINLRSVITIQIWFDLTRFRKDFSACTVVLEKKNVRIMRKLGAFTQRIVFFSFYPRFRNIIKYLKCIYFCGSYGPPSLSSDTYTNIWAKKFGSARSALLHTRPSRNWLSALLRCVYTQRNLLKPY